MVALGYGKYARATDIVALIPIEDGERGEGRRTYVYVTGLDAPIVASRSQRAILADMRHAPNLAPGVRERPTDDGAHTASTDGRAGRWRLTGGASANGRRRA